MEYFDSQRDPTVDVSKQDQSSSRANDATGLASTPSTPLSNASLCLWFLDLWNLGFQLSEHVSLLHAPIEFSCRSDSRSHCDGIAIAIGPGKTRLGDSHGSKSVVLGHFDPIAAMVIRHPPPPTSLAIPLSFPPFRGKKKNLEFLAILQQSLASRSVFKYWFLIFRLLCFFWLFCVVLGVFLLQKTGIDSLGFCACGKNFCMVLDVFRHSSGGYSVFSMFIFNLDFVSLDSHRYGKNLGFLQD